MKMEIYERPTELPKNVLRIALRQIGGDIRLECVTSTGNSIDRGVIFCLQIMDGLVHGYKTKRISSKLRTFVACDMDGQILD